MLGHAPWARRLLLLLTSLTMLAACKDASTGGADSTGGASSGLRQAADANGNYIDDTSDDTGPAAAATPTTPGSNWQQPDDHRVTRFVGMVADKPATWIEHPAVTSMEATRFNVPGKGDSAAAEIVVFYFGPGQGGSLDSNIERWRNQFRPNEDGSLVEADVSSHTANDDIAITLVEIKGDYMRMGAAFFTPKQHFITAIVEGPQGMVFVRFVGEEATVGPNRDAFIAMMKSLRIDAGDAEN